MVEEGGYFYVKARLPHSETTGLLRNDIFLGSASSKTGGLMKSVLHLHCDFPACKS